MINEKRMLETPAVSTLERAYQSMDTVPQGKPPQQLPNCVREVLLGIGLPKSALMLDLLLTLGFQEGQWVTYEQVIDACKQYTSFNVIRDGLNGYVFRKKRLKQTRRGRPTVAFQIPKIDHLKYKYAVKWSKLTDTLLLADFRNVKTYRMGLHRELIARGHEESGQDGAIFSRKWMAERLGVSAETLRNYEGELKTYVEARFHKRPMKSTADLMYLDDKRDHNGKFLVVYYRDTYKHMPAIKGLGGLLLKQGHEFELHTRLPNRYFPENPYLEQQQIEENNRFLQDLFRPHTPSQPSNARDAWNQMHNQSFTQKRE